MNLPSINSQANQATSNAPSTEDGGNFNLLDMLDVVIDNRWVICAVTALTLCVGILYATVSTPIYEADMLVQVEDTKGSPMGALVGEAGGMFDVKSSAAAEMEILRSRMVSEQVVSKLHLDLDIRPKYWPIIGEWMSRRSSELSKPGLLFWGGFVNGTESVKIDGFSVSGAGDRNFVIRATDTGFALIGSSGKELTRGPVGQALPFEQDGQKGEIKLRELKALPGAEFILRSRSRQAVIDALRRDLKITEQGKQSGVLRASLYGDSPERIAAILNEIGASYVKQNVARKAAEAEKSLQFLNTQLPQLKKELEAAEDKYNGFRNRQGTFDLGVEAKSMLDQTTGLNVRLQELVQKRKELELRYTDQHPAMQAIDGQIKSVKTQMSVYESKTKSLPSLEQELFRLARDVKVTSELYTNLSNTTQQLRLVKEGKVGNVRVVDTAEIPERAVRPVKPLVISVSLVLGLVIGVIIAFVKNSLNAGIKDASEIETHLGVNVYATIPYSIKQVELAEAAKSKKSGMHLLSVAQPSDVVIESLRSLRTSIQFAMLETSNNIVLMTGPTPGIGKSFVSANFAAVMAAGGKRVLLIDADMRKGHIHEYFGMTRGQGFSDLIAHGCELSEAIHKQVVPNLDFITTGNMPPNPAEILGSHSTKELLDRFSADYDLVLIDSPPILAVSDASVLAQLAGSVFMISRADQTSLGELHESNKRISQAGASVQGVIFNGLDMSKRRYGYGGYKYGYRYSRYRYRDYNYKQTSSNS